MEERSRDLTALIGSRICHDLISPIGAIGNGLELMAMSDVGAGPELSLINESVANANARIRFYRVAYGSSGDGQSLGRSEIVGLLDDITRGAKLSYHWEPVGDILRREVKLAFLALQCLEYSMPYGGDVIVERQEGNWTLKGEAKKLRIEPHLWSFLTAPDNETEIAPSEVQFALLPELLAETGRRATAQMSDTHITVAF
ncbi:MAG: histidine phosphotransferase family protein [Pseudomonadota bacterium]